MEEKGDKSIMDLPPPAYFPKVNVSRQTCAWASVVILLLAVIVVGATLIGVHMTQKHTEAVVEMSFHAGSGEKVQQTVMVNDKDNMAAFYININNTSSTILYDYGREIIGLKSDGDCYVIKMSATNAPTMADVLNSIKYPQEQDAAGRDYLYNVARGEKADRAKLGVPITLLCSDLPIYWASEELRQQQQRGLGKFFKKIGNVIKNHVVPAFGAGLGSAAAAAVIAAAG